jgi:hypothetical protein
MRQLGAVRNTADSASVAAGARPAIEAAIVAAAEAIDATIDMPEDPKALAAARAALMAAMELVSRAAKGRTA